MALIIPVDDSSSTSAEFAATIAAPVTLSLEPAAGQSLPSDASAEVQRETAASEWMTVGHMAATPIESRMFNLAANGSFRVVKAKRGAYGVDKS